MQKHTAKDSRLDSIPHFSIFGLSTTYRCFQLVLSDISKVMRPADILKVWRYILND